MARLQVEVTLTIVTQVEVETQEWEPGDEHLIGDVDQQAAFDAISAKFTKDDALDLDADDFNVVSVIRSSDVEIPKVSAPRHLDMWEEE